MGFDAIYISPSINNTQGGYHGYWPEDFYTINPKFGGPERLKELVREAHARNIWVMADVVLNHSGKFPAQALTPPLNDESHFHPPCVIDYNNQWSVEHCRISSLPDIDTENQQMVDYLSDWVEWFTKEFNFDGVRLDAVKHVRKSFWPGIAARSGVFAVGEVYHGDPKYVGPYQDYLPSVFNYPMYYTIQDVFANKHDMSVIPWRLQEVRSQFRDTTVLGTFIDNHDVRRFMNATSAGKYICYLRFYIKLIQ